MLERIWSNKSEISFPTSRNAKKVQTLWKSLEICNFVMKHTLGHLGGFVS